jgi:hypothetical protein
VISEKLIFDQKSQFTSYHDASHGTKGLILTKLIRISLVWIHTDCLMSCQTHLELLSLHSHHFCPDFMLASQPGRPRSSDKSWDFCPDFMLQV